MKKENTTVTTTTTNNKPVDLASAFTTAISKMNAETAQQLVAVATIASKTVSQITTDKLETAKTADDTAQAIRFNEDSKRNIAMKCFMHKQALTTYGAVEVNGTLYKTVDKLAAALDLTPSTFKRYANCGSTPIAKDPRFDDKSLDFFDKTYRLLNPADKDDKRVFEVKASDISPLMTVKDLETLLDKARGKIVDTTAKTVNSDKDEPETPENNNPETVSINPETPTTETTTAGEIKIDNKNNAIHLKNVTASELIEWANKAIKNNNLVKHINGTLTFTKI